MSLDLKTYIARRTAEQDHVYHAAADRAVNIVQIAQNWRDHGYSNQEAQDRALAAYKQAYNIAKHNDVPNVRRHARRLKAFHDNITNR